MSDCLRLMYMNVLYILYIKVEIYAYCTIYLNGGWLPHKGESRYNKSLTHRGRERQGRESI